MPSHRGPDSGPLLQRAGLTVKVPAPGSSRGRAGPAPLLSESESREENLSEFLRKLALSSQGWFSRRPSMFCSKASHCFRCAPFGKDTATCLSLTPIAGNAEPVRTALASGGGDGQGQLLRHLCLFQGPPVLEAVALGRRTDRPSCSDSSPSAATSHTWLVNTWNVATEAGELNLKLCLIFNSFE